MFKFDLKMILLALSWLNVASQITLRYLPVLPEVLYDSKNGLRALRFLGVLQSSIVVQSQESLSRVGKTTLFSSPFPETDPPVPSDLASSSVMSSRYLSWCITHNPHYFKTEQHLKPEVISNDSNAYKADELSDEPTIGSLNLLMRQNRAD